MRKDYTFLTYINRSSYIPGVIGLYKSLIKAQKNDFNFAVFITDEEKGLEVKLKDLFCKHNDVTIIISEPLPEPKFQQKNDYWKGCISTLKIFGLTQYKKIVYLDADMLVLSDLSDLFEKPHMSGVASSSIVHPEINNVVFGPLVIVPNKEEEKKLIEIYLTRKITLADQEVIRIRYKNWVDQEELHLPIVYGAYYPHLSKIIKITKIKKDSFKIIHFVGQPKPWEYKIKNKLSILKWCLFCRTASVWLFKILIKYISYCNSKI